MSKTSYDDAVTYFNGKTNCTADDISYAYDSQKNILIKHYNDIQGDLAAGGAICFVGAAVSGTVMLNSFHNVYTAPDEAAAKEAMPDISVGLSLIFGFLTYGAARATQKIYKAVEREVAQSTRQKDTPVI
ncbi:MAG: hypothetical protein VX740_07340 [Pseudomonadota bacterium]|nr:hypothetical protein [Pseudomonadota bacterium]MEC9235794.1 hypothetical protein [Pseudomonadota bacterium]MED5423237.1 hypothetical protein [Pseudomonadota bacterium]MEE3322979.1 hypothetical protein [Pseudomonadota bacterium]